MANKLKILIIGGGGREHAIGWKLRQSPRAGDLYFAPGNAGTATIGINVNIKATEIDKLLDFTKKEKIDLTLAVPDDPLALGIVDKFRAEGLRIWGPTQSAAKLEWSKSFSKDFMHDHNLPTARYKVFTDYAEAKGYVERQKMPIVIKASGLALGKGVVICENVEQAVQTLENILVKKVFGEAGNEVVIEEFLVGPEVSIHAFCDGESYKMFPVSQDHKKIGEGDTGLNTGGIGAISPVPFINKEQEKEIETTIVKATLDALRKEGIEFKGILYPGLILTEYGPKLLEYNARPGDPETEVYMRMLENDLLDIIEATIEDRLDEIDIKWRNVAACNIVLVSNGYPENYEKGKVITGIQNAEQDPDIVVFHSGTTIKDNLLVTNGGRVLGVSATGVDLKQALDKAYKAITKINFEGMQYRRDIGKKTLEMI